MNDPQPHFKTADLRTETQESFREKPLALPELLEPLTTEETRQALQLLRASEAFQRVILNSLPAHIAVLDKTGTILAVNEPWLRFARENGNSEVRKIGVGANYLDACYTACGQADKHAKAAADGIEAVLSGMLPRFSLEYPCDAPGISRWYVMEVIPLAEKDGGAIVAHTCITKRKQAQNLLAWEKSALESILNTASPDQVLDRLMLGMEKQLPGTLCSVLLLDADGTHLRRGAAPSLPDDYNRAIDGIAIGTAAGSCGTVKHKKRQVTASDIGSDPLWTDHRELALSHGLRACWPTPIHCSKGKILGTLAIYLREPRFPVAAEMEVIERAVQVVRIAIERLQTRKKILQLNADLEQRVEKRTVELQAVNTSLTDFKAALDEHAVVAITDIDGTISYANDRFCEISHYSREELLGQNHRIINSGYHPEAFFQDMWQTILSGRVWKGEIKNCGKDGSFYWVYSTLVPFLGADGKPTQFIAICTDITKRKHMEEALLASGERLRLAAEVANIAVWEWDLRTDQLTWDVRMFNIYGLPPDPEGRARNSDWASAVLPEDLAEQESRLQHTLATCGRDQREFRIKRASDQAVRVIQASEMVIVGDDGKADRMVGINFDSTDIKQAEERIRMLNVTLESRAAALEAANQELESFSYSVSHDLRAPLRAVDGFSRMVLEDYAQRLDDEGRRMLGVICSETQRMSRLINDLLAFSRLGRQQIEPEPIDMRVMAQEVYDELVAQEPPDRKLKLDLQPLPVVEGTRAMIRQVWVNIIGNAIKFTKRREVGEIEIAAQPGEDGVPVFQIKDNGAGFDMRFADKLFGVFQRLHSPEEFPGTGVGLALVQRIVNRHGGCIWAVGEVDHGATFNFTLAAKKPAFGGQLLKPPLEDSLSSTPADHTEL